MILRLAPRDPVLVTPEMLDEFWAFDAWVVSNRHLRHVDNSKAGILATIPHRGDGNPLYLIDGFHRATNHREDRTNWSCYVLTPQESYSILTPLCYCRKGTR
jgi:hypothetical protein